MTNFIIDISPDLAHNAQYQAITDVPNTYIKSGTTFRLFPGEYDAIPSTSNLSNITFMGVGAKENVIINGVVLGASNIGTIRFDNLTIRGSDANSTGSAMAVQVSSIAASAALEFNGVKLSNARYGVRNAGSGTVTFNRSEVDCDVACLSNSAMAFNYTKMSTSANAYANSGNATVQAITVISSYAGAGNGAITTETVRSMIS